MREEKSEALADHQPWAALQAEIVACRRCPRLVAWREAVAQQKVARFCDQLYWGRPVPGFGDVQARLWVIGLAPAAHGATAPGGCLRGIPAGIGYFALCAGPGLPINPSLCTGKMACNCGIATSQP